uniref:Uncharacterized protein n=1 Tax=Takifugu rubripes TaxID=31033 RepID=A0A3B5K5V0_TAKRU
SSFFHWVEMGEVGGERAIKSSDFLKLRRKYHRLHCHHRRCVALHSRVPFP